MKIRVKFTKSGPIRFIGHLDVMRFFQKALRRADIDVRYSEGFSPHQIMSFAAPLGLGDTSECEYMDIEVGQAPGSEEMKARLNAVSVEGIEILSCRMLPEKCKNAMASTAAADYRLSFREGYEPDAAFWDELNAFVQQPEIVIRKKTKKSEKEVDIRPLIQKFETAEGRIFCRVTAGSEDNLKPERIVEAFCAASGRELPPFALQTHRVELYARDEQGNLISLEDLGVEF